MQHTLIFLLVPGVFNEIAPNKEIRIKNSPQVSLDRKIVQLIHAWKKLFLKVKKSKFHINEDIYKQVLNS